MDGSKKINFSPSSSKNLVFDSKVRLMNDSPKNTLYDSSMLQNIYDSRDLLTRLADQLRSTDDPNMTKETLVLRTLKNLTENTFHLSWSRVLDTLRQGQCFFDFESHALLKRALAWSSRHQPYDEAIDRIASKDYVKKTDVDRLATVLSVNGFENNLDACRLFAVDGFAGFHDLKLYGNHFKNVTEDFKKSHIRAVRTLYENYCNDPRQVVKVIESVLGDEPLDETQDAQRIAAQDTYLVIVGPEKISAIRQWKFKERQQVLDSLATKKLNEAKKRSKTNAKRNVESRDKHIESKKNIVSKKRKHIETENVGKHIETENVESKKRKHIDTDNVGKHLNKKQKHSENCTMNEKKRGHKNKEEKTKSSNQLEKISQPVIIVQDDEQNNQPTIEEISQDLNLSEESENESQESENEEISQDLNLSEESGNEEMSQESGNEESDDNENEGNAALKVLIKTAAMSEQQIQNNV